MKNIITISFGKLYFIAQANLKAMYQDSKQVSQACWAYMLHVVTLNYHRKAN